jgi:hypothetical protein
LILCMSLFFQVFHMTLFEYLSYLSCCMHCPSHPSWINYPGITWRKVQIKHLIIMQLHILLFFLCLHISQLFHQCQSTLFASVRSSSKQLQSDTFQYVSYLRQKIKNISTTGWAVYNTKQQ